MRESRHVAPQRARLRDISRSAPEGNRGSHQGAESAWSRTKTTAWRRPSGWLALRGVHERSALRFFLVAFFSAALSREGERTTRLRTGDQSQRVINCLENNTWTDSWHRRFCLHCLRWCRSRASSACVWAFASTEVTRKRMLHGWFESWPTFRRRFRTV